MSDSTSSPALPEWQRAFSDLEERLVSLEEGSSDTETDLQMLKLRISSAPTSNGNGLFNALFLTKEGRYSREKALAALLTIAPLVLEILPLLGVPLDSNPTFNLLITTLGASKWRQRHMQDLPADNTRANVTQ